MENWEIDRDTIKTVGGHIKMGNRPCPKAAIRTRVPEGHSPLSITTASGTGSASVPVRGYVYIPYSKHNDIGGDFVDDGAAYGSEDFVNRRGRSFELNISFEIPIDQKLYPLPTDSSGDLVTGKDFVGNENEYLDACTILAQKGGNRMAPMSWALGIVNIGDTEVWDMVTGDVGTNKATYLRPVFMWLDAPEWGNADHNQMDYDLGSGSVQCTQALRAVVIDHAIEPGRNYSLSFGLSIDAGSIGAFTDTGQITCNIIEDTKDVNDGAGEYHYTDTSSPTSSGIFVWKGPTDSMEYLCKYGIRYSSRDPMYLGLGYRSIPWLEDGNIPFGVDAASLEKGGMSMVRASDLDSMGNWPNMTKQSGYFDLPAQYLTLGSTVSARDWYTSPWGPSTSSASAPDWAVWNGFGDVSGIGNVESLRGYRLYQNGWDGSAPGMFTVDSYVDTGPPYRLSYMGSDATTPGAKETFLIAFRWNQIEMVLSDFRIYSRPRDYDNVREQWSLRSTLDVHDDTEPDLEDLLGYWPLSDGGDVLRDHINGIDGYMAPFSLANDERGTIGKDTVFLSGEGESIILDLSENPIFDREFLGLLRENKQGIAIQITCRIPGGEYSVADEDSDFNTTDANDIVSAYVGDLISWDLKDPDDPAIESTPRPLLKFGYKTRVPHADVGASRPFRQPAAFNLFVADQSDNDNLEMKHVVSSWADSGPILTPTFDVDGSRWVGETVTFQVGLEPAGTADDFIGYVHATPAHLFSSVAGSDPNGEFSVFSSSFEMKPKDLSRSVITIGGSWRPGKWGWTELSTPLIVDEVRIFGTTAAGATAGTTGEVIDDRSGKILGGNALPLAPLGPRDIVKTAGPSLGSVSVVDGSATVSSSTGGIFHRGSPEDTQEAVEGTYLIVAGDEHEVRKGQTAPEIQEEFYYVSDQPTGVGDTITLLTPYAGQSLDRVYAGSFRLVGYTAFGDDVRDRSLAVSSGAGLKFDSGGTLTTTSDVVLAKDMWSNRTPVSGDFGVRIYSPLTASSVADVTPRWVGGIKEPRSNMIRGLHGFNDRLFVGAGGCLYECDDRWRQTQDGVESLTWLQFRSQWTGFNAPLARDRVELDSADQLAIADMLTTNTALVYDFEVILDEVRGIQTVLWVGDPQTDSQGAVSSSGNEMNHWIRFNNGVPQFVVGSNATYVGGAGPPQQGYYTATGAISVKPGERSHVRWIIERVSNTYALTPVLLVNGRKISVDIDTTEGTLPEWVQLDGTVDAGTDIVGLIGVAHDTYEAVASDLAFNEDEVAATYLKPSIYQGYLHSLNGKLRKLRVGTDAALISATVGIDANYNFDFRNLEYSGTFTGIAQIDFDEGVGHKVHEETGDTYEVIYSHPFIPHFAGLEDTDNMYSMVTYGDQVYMANGDKPVVYDDDYGARLAGIDPPATKPDFEVERLGLWVANNDTTVSDEVRDPWDPTTSTYHYASHGNAYLTHPFHKRLAWEENDFFFFKCYLKPRSVSGRIPIYSARTSLESGGVFVEIRDGKCVLGWYDVSLKKEVTVETSEPVFRAGRWHYLYVRKKYPTGDGWTDTIFGDATASTVRDSMIVREFPVAAALPGSPEQLSWLAKHSFPSNISFTENTAAPVGCTATGVAADTTETFTGGASGVMTASAGGYFDEDMIGMFFQLATDETLYKISSLNSSQEAVLYDWPAGTLADTSAVGGGTAGCVFMGCKLIASDGFGDSEEPDPVGYNSEFFGSVLCTNPDNGLTPFDGEFGDVGLHYTVAGSTKVFTNNTTSEKSELGVDSFNDDIFDGAAYPEGLDFTGAVATANTIVLQDSDPNEDLEVAQGTNGHADMDPALWQRGRAIQMLSGKRRVAVTFYDIDQNVESNPSPILEILPSGEDAASTSGEARIKLTNIPVAPREGNIVRRVYMTLADGATPQLIGEIEDNTTGMFSIYKDEFQIAQGRLLSYDNQAPPRCRILSSDQGVMWYGDLDGQRDGVLYSQPFTPTSLGISNLLVFNTGDNSPITGLHSHSGRMLVFKRDSIHAVLLSQIGPLQELISKGVGCVSHTSIDQVDDVLYCLDTRGMAVIPPAGRPFRFSEKIAEYVDVDADKLDTSRAYGAIDRRNDQYVVTLKEASSNYRDVRYSASIDDGPNGHRFARFRGPNLTAVGTMWDRLGDDHTFVGGTEEGFCVWLSRGDTSLSLLGPTTKVWGSSSVTLTADGGPFTTITVNSGIVDATLSGPRGSIVRWLDADGVTEYSGVILGLIGTTILLDRKTSNPIVSAQLRGIIGATRPQYHSKWYDLDHPELCKDGLILDVTRTIQDSGSLTLTTHQDFLDTERSTASIDLTAGLGHVNANAKGGVLQFRLSEPFTGVGTEAEIVDIVWRVQVADNW